MDAISGAVGSAVGAKVVTHNAENTDGQISDTEITHGESSMVQEIHK